MHQHKNPPLEMAFLGEDPPVGRWLSLYLYLYLYTQEYKRVPPGNGLGWRGAPCGAVTGYWNMEAAMLASHHHLDKSVFLKCISHKVYF